MPTSIYPNETIAELAKTEVEKILNDNGYRVKGVQILRVDSLSEQPTDNLMDVEITISVNELSIVRTWKRDPPTPIFRDPE